MKKLLFLSLFIISNKNFAQKNNWKEFSKEKITTLNINKTRIYKVQNYKLNVVWNEKLSSSENIGFYGGIEKLTIYKDNKEIQIINKIEDNIALGTIYFNFYDYNLDGYLDFTLPINSRWLMYFIFNPQSNEFEHKVNWDYLRIQKIDKKNKLILSQPSGNAFEDNRKIYKIKGLEIIEIEKK
jgi:hypothetical protein